MDPTTPAAPASPWWQHCIDAGLGALITGVLTALRDRQTARRREKIREATQEWEHAFKSTELGKALFESLASSQHREIERLQGELQDARDLIQTLQSQLKAANDRIDSLERAIEKGKE